MEKSHLESNASSSDSAIVPGLVWNVHLVRDEPRKLFLILPVVLISLIACYLIFRSPFFIAILLLLFSSALAEYLFPVRYEISTKGASSRTLFSRNFIEWERVKKIYLDECGVKLSPLSRQGRLEAFRGVYLRFGDRRDEVIEAVRRMRDVARTDS